MASCTATAREQYFILGSYYDMLGQDEKGIAEYRVLLSLYPDHYWATTNMAFTLVRLGRVEEAAPFWARCADLRPNDFRRNQWAAGVLFLMNDLSRARFYNEQARQLVSAEVLKRVPQEVADVELFSAREHWLRGDVEKTLSEVDRLAQTLKSRSAKERRSFSYKVASSYLALGMLQAAEELFQSPDTSRPKIHNAHILDELAIVALAREDQAALRQRLTESLNSTPGLATAVLLARRGFFSEAEKVMQRLISRRGRVWPSDKIVRGELAMARGKTAQAIRLLQEGIEPPWMGPFISAYFLGTETLANAWEQQGNMSKAIRLLEESSQGRAKALAALRGSSSFFWMRVRLRLASFYRKVGREQEAREIEAELRKLLAYADPDHPILRQLKRLQEFAVYVPQAMLYRAATQNWLRCQRRPRPHRRGLVAPHGQLL